MSRIAQAFDRRQRHIIASASAKATMLVLGFALSGCGMGGFSLKQVEADRSIITGAVPAEGGTADPDLDSDKATIRNAVSSADIEGLSGKAVPWENAGTGSRGSVTELEQFKQENRLCRRFSASRASYDGVTMYKGRACLVAPGAWRIEAFAAL